MPMSKLLTILVDCPDDKGLIYKITGVLYQNGLNIIKNREYVDLETNRFFMRTEVEGQIDEQELESELKMALPDQSLVSVVSDRKKKIVLLVTKENHCLGDLLIRNHFGEWNAEVKAVIGNYEVLRNFTERFDIPYHCVSAEGLTRKEHEEQLMAVIDRYSPDCLVLAKYMRILTPEFVGHYEGKVINIHHSFLPAFIGANPYKQAYERGVKIIGATAHFVNHHLDEGPIICQNVIPVDHSQNAIDMARAGKDVEKMVLAQALKLVLEDKVMVSGNKTVVF